MKNKYYSSLLWFGFNSGFRKYTIVILLLEALSVVFSAVSPMVQKNLIDGANTGQQSVVIYSAVILAILLMGQFSFLNLGRFLRGLLGVVVRKDLKSIVFRHLLALPEDFLRSRGAGYFFNRIQNDTGEITSFISGNALAFSAEIIKLAVGMIMIVLLDWRYGVLVVPFLIIQGFICYKFRLRQYHLSLKLQECVASERHVMQEYLSNHTTIKTLAANESAGERVDRGLNRWSELMRSRLTHENIFLACLQIPAWLCGAIIVLSGLYLVLLKQSTLGEVWALLALMKLVFAPVRSLGAIFVRYQASAAAWIRLQDIFNQPLENNGLREEECNLRGDLEIHSVTFAYSAERTILSNLELSVPYGTGVFLCGANGSGKSTLFSLLLRLYKPQEGKIIINGININEFALNSYRSRIGYVGQNTEFIRGTLRSNLTLGNDEISDSQILELFDKLECREFYDRLPDGLNTIVSERGENFSGGERLRMALIREMLRCSDWLLFDEAAANLDKEGRQKFYEILQKLPGSKGVIAIVHDLPENSTWPVIQLEKIQS